MLEELLGSRLLGTIMLIICMPPFVYFFIAIGINDNLVFDEEGEVRKGWIIYFFSYLTILISLFFVPVEFLDWLL